MAVGKGWLWFTVYGLLSFRVSAAGFRLGAILQQEESARRLQSARNPFVNPKPSDIGDDINRAWSIIRKIP